MSVNQNTIRKFKRLFDAEMKAHDKYSAALNVGFAGYSDAQEKALQNKSNAAAEKIFSEFKKHRFTEVEWDELLSDCGSFDCGWDYETMIESNENN